MESTVKDARHEPTGWVVDNKSTVGGGVEDAYGEDCATEDHIITPWSVSVARSVVVVRVLC